MSSVSSLVMFIVPPMGDRIRLARDEIVGYAGRITSMASIDDVIVFAIFFAVRSLLQQSSPFLKG